MNKATFSIVWCLVLALPLGCSSSEENGNPEDHPLACALYLSKTLKDVLDKDIVSARIAIQYAEAEQFDLALELTKTIKDVECKTIALTGVASNYMKAEQFDQAFKVAMTIEDAEAKADALIELAGEYAESGQKERLLRYCLRPWMLSWQ